jgi:hypothetical protein
MWRACEYLASRVPERTEAIARRDLALLLAVDGALCGHGLRKIWVVCGLVSAWRLHCHAVGLGVDRNHCPDAVVWDSINGRAALLVLDEVARRVLSRDLGIAQRIFDMDNEGFAIRGNSPLRLEAGADELIELVTFSPVRSDHDCTVETLGVSRDDGGEAMVGIGVLVDGGLGAGTLTL